MSIKLKLLPKPKDNSDMFEEKTIKCNPNVPGLFRYAEAIVGSEIKANKGREFVLEMLRFSKQAWEANNELAEKKV